MTIAFCYTLLTQQENGWWLRGVQWHPENLVAMHLQRALWEDFVKTVDGGSRP